MSSIRVIKSEADYDVVMERLLFLMDQEIVPGSALESELELLCWVVKTYEENKIEPIHVDPIEAVRFRLAQQQF